MAAVGAAGVALALRGLEGGGRWVALAVAALFLLGGLSAALSRFELTLDLKGRRLLYRRGSVFGMESGEELRGASLLLRWPPVHLHRSIRR